MDDDADVKMSAKLKQTKFPVARIKRIMQKDDEVGKVAQATPIVISKALELFLSKLVEDTAKVTTGRGAKRVEAYHLKHAIENIDSFDFLRELVASVPDPSAGGTIPMREPSGGGAAGADDSDEEGAPKKRRGRRKKDTDADEEDPPVEKKRRGRKPKEPAGEGEVPKKRGRKKKEEPPPATTSWARAPVRPPAPEPAYQEPMEDDGHPAYDDDVPVRDDEDEYDDQDGGYGAEYSNGRHSGGGWR